MLDELSDKLSCRYFLGIYGLHTAYAPAIPIQQPGSSDVKKQQACV
jgi:hypothetical protein